MPNLYELPKMQKPGDEMRPIVSNIVVSTYGLAKYLVTTFSSIKKFESLSVKNNIELVNKLTHFYLRNNN